MHAHHLQSARRTPSEEQAKTASRTPRSLENRQLKKTNQGKSSIWVKSLQLHHFEVKVNDYVLAHGDLATVYDLCRAVPAGKITTYGEIAKKLECGSSQAIGQALKHNPFATAHFAPPYPEHMVPCHRVVATDLTIGGFSGATDPSSREICNKVALLKKEGVKISQKNGKIKVWRTLEPQC